MSQGPSLQYPVGAAPLEGKQAVFCCRSCGRMPPGGVAGGQVQADLTCPHAVTCLRAFAQEPGACSVARESLHDGVCEAAGSGRSGAAPAAFSAHHIIEGSSFSSGGVSSSSPGTPVLFNT